jgi:hypothetical protein
VKEAAYIPDAYLKVTNCGHYLCAECAFDYKTGRSNIKCGITETCSRSTFSVLLSKQTTSGVRPPILEISTTENPSSSNN